ncbi:MAG TPA: hypothetical protein PK590_05435 [Candidatus Omnitrophota bacterium]|jgi:hypothetical protein|nr:MAG: hypothetical protein BWY58_00926 [Chloroflexi bacterium ADurb.Bin344]HOG24072.1 hypothetical protein [Candidatus Omnitrophota bacterium]HPW77447.1 hypothetical protein [Candidatus Omnitrophota bacterium]HQB11672.1 hypothetical protein [Candidatus Omnitrophota bacterium]
MKFPKGSRFYLLVGLILGAICQVAVAQEEPWTAQFLREFEQIKQRLTQVENQRQEILTRQDKIIEELDMLRIQIRRRSK